MFDFFQQSNTIFFYKLDVQVNKDMLDDTIQNNGTAKPDLGFG